MPNPPFKDITPPGLCAGGIACPAVFEITPSEMRCGMTAACPAVFERGWNDLVVIGKVLTAEDLAKMDGFPTERIGAGEGAFLIPRALVANLKDDK